MAGLTRGRYSGMEEGRVSGDDIRGLAPSLAAEGTAGTGDPIKLG